jgi:hypothetical protein
VIITGWEKTSGKDEPRSKISVYNYETMQLVKDLTDYSQHKYTAIDVSADGRYLATLNDGKAYLKVWDLSTMELIRDVQLWDDYLPTDWWCKSDDVEFSENNSDIIYFSGGYPGDAIKPTQTGLYKYSIEPGLVDTNFPYIRYSGKIIMFDNENRSLTYSSLFLFFYDFNDGTSDRYYKPTDVYPGGKTIYYKQGNFFISFENKHLCQFLYDRGTSVESPTKEITISPNPTGSFVNISLDCTEPQVSYQISDINGLLLFEENIASASNALQIDFSPYPAGVYFLTINCGDSPLTYKVIRE